MAILIEPPQNELSALQDLSDSAGFLKKTGDGTYSIDINSYLSLAGGTITGDLVSTSATVSTSPTTGAIRGASLGITGAIFAGTVSANSYNLIPIWRGGGNISTNTVVGMNAGLSNTTGIQNSFVGMNAGRSNTTGIQNSFVGVNAGRFNTTGIQNSFVGVNAGLSNTTGNNNSFVGVDAGYSNTTGNNNSFVGVHAGLSNTTGNNNSFVGVDAGLSNTTGNNNSFVGVDAGRYTSDGVTDLTISNNSCFFGMNTKGTQNATNENVFGFGATGSGSNTVTIGDNNIVRTYLKGVVDVANTTPSTSTTTGGLVVSGGVGVGGDVFANTVNAASKITVGQNFSISSISGYSNISLGNNFTSEYGRSSIEIPTNTLYGGLNNHHTGVKLVCGEMVGWGTAKFKIYTSNNWTTYNPIACFSVGDAGGVFAGSSKATSFIVGANQVVSNRKIGWTAPTGTASRSTFSTATVTLSQLAERVKALIDDLIAHGLIGA